MTPKLTFRIAILSLIVISITSAITIALDDWQKVIFTIPNLGTCSFKYNNYTIGIHLTCLAIDLLLLGKIAFSNSNSNLNNVLDDVE